MKPKRFSQSTCDALLSLVLQSCSTRQMAEQSSLNPIASQDGDFAQWLSQVPTGLSVADALVRDPSWRDETSASERLWQAANIALRLQAWEQQFADTLATQKREAIYHFAYGLSHELNNPLANIATRAGVLAHGESAVDRRQMLETIIDNAMRGSQMLGDLMLLARPPQMDPRTVVLSEWFEALSARCQAWAAKRNLSFDARCDLRSQTASFDPIAITEAVWCLVRNAFEASGEHDTVQVCLEEKNEFLYLSVVDSGPGLSAAGLKHCFDPYFSGREAGRGLGLGLSKAQLIATLHRGTLTVCNRSAGGCEAVLSLPS